MNHWHTYTLAHAHWHTEDRRLRIQFTLAHVTVQSQLNTSSIVNVN